jgi:hypothetical protein
MAGGITIVPTRRMFMAREVKEKLNPAQARLASLAPQGFFATTVRFQWITSFQRMP